MNAQHKYYFWSKINTPATQWQTHQISLFCCTFLICVMVILKSDWKKITWGRSWKIINDRDNLLKWVLLINRTLKNILTRDLVSLVSYTALNLWPKMTGLPRVHLLDPTSYIIQRWNKYNKVLKKISPNE